MYGLRAIILSLAAAAPLAQGAVYSLKAAAVTPAVSPAPTEGPLFEGAQWTSGEWTSGERTATWSSWTNEDQDQDQDQDQDNERRAATVTHAPTVGLTFHDGQWTSGTRTFTWSSPTNEDQTAVTPAVSPVPTVGPSFEKAQWTSGEWTSGERTATWSSWTNEDQDNEQDQDNERRAAAVTPAPTAGPSFKGAQWTSGERTSTWSSWTNEDQDQEQDNERRAAPTMVADSVLGPFFKSIVSRLRDLEKHETVTVTVPAEEPFVTATATVTAPAEDPLITAPADEPFITFTGRPVYTETDTWDFSVAAVNTNEAAQTSLPFKAANVAAAATTAPAMATYLRKSAGQRIVTSSARNSTNQTATASSTSRPTVPPTSGGVANAAAPVMGAVAVFIAACALAL
ncbi:hypothetical protein GGI35DRAFT_474576 [Trichoderma velutinum]